MKPTKDSALDPSTAPTPSTDAIAQVAITATLMVCTAAVVAVSVGDPELMALVAITGIVVLLLARTALSVKGHTAAENPNRTDDRSGADRRAAR